MQELLGCHAETGYEHWKILLDEWMSVMLRYHRVSVTDVPYWYTERANVGLLAAAAWRCGYIALEEYGDVKRDTETKDSYVGRVDLWIARPDAPGGELIEAKLEWLSLTRETEEIALKDKLEKALAPAIADARKTKTGKSLPAYGICFVVPWISGEVEQEVLEQRLVKLTAAIGELKSDIYAWYFPKEFREIRNFHGRNYPGVILLGKRVLRGI